MCTMKDLCLPSKPCINNGRCIQRPSKVVCDCKGTDHTGQHCETKSKVFKYQASCSGYFKLGYRTNTEYTIQPGSGSAFKVYCDMNNEDGPKTIVKTTMKHSTNNVFQSKSYDSEFYYHAITYKASKQQLVSLIGASLTCRQYVRYDCVASSLLNTFKTERASNLGIRWYSRKGFPRRYWHGDASTANQQSCRCGMKGNCESPDVLCNCDLRSDNTPRYDDGFITEKDDLPISKIRVSIQRTNHRSSFYIGNLECSDNVNASNVVPSFVPELATDINGVVMLKPTSPRSNNTDIEGQKKKVKSLVLIDTKLLYALIISVIFLIALLLLILILKRRLCCCYYANKAKPQIVEIYKDAEMPSPTSPQHLRNLNHHNQITSNNNKNSFQFADHDASMKKGRKSESESSVSTLGATRYYQHYHNSSDSDTLSLAHSNAIIPPEPPVRTVLKIKKELALKRQNANEQARLSSASEASVTSNNTNSSNNNNNNNNNKPNRLNSPSSHTDAVLSSSSRGFNNVNRNLSSNNTTTPNNSSNRGSTGSGNSENGISPLKQKILEMSTSKQRLHSGEIYFHHQDSLNSSAAIKSLSSSSSSSKESDINTSTDEDDLPAHDLSELLLPNARAQTQRSKGGARLTEEEKKEFYAHMYRTTAGTNSTNAPPLKNNKGGNLSTPLVTKQLTLADFRVRNDEYSYKDDQSKTLV